MASAVVATTGCSSHTPSLLAAAFTATGEADLPP
jgi:hypothetical protein